MSPLSQPGRRPAGAKPEKPLGLQIWIVGVALGCCLRTPEQYFEERYTVDALDMGGHSRLQQHLDNVGVVSFNREREGLLRTFDNFFIHGRRDPHVVHGSLGYWPMSKRKKATGW